MVNSSAKGFCQIAICQRPKRFCHIHCLFSRGQQLKGFKETPQKPCTCKQNLPIYSCTIRAGFNKLSFAATIDMSFLRCSNRFAQACSIFGRQPLDRGCSSASGHLRGSSKRHFKASSTDTRAPEGLLHRGLSSRSQKYIFKSCQYSIA